jgi:hypothetical protein
VLNISKSIEGKLDEEKKTQRKKEKYGKKQTIE